METVTTLEKRMETFPRRSSVDLARMASYCEWVRVSLVLKLDIQWRMDKNALMHHAFRPCSVVEIPKERIDAVFAYGMREWGGMMLTWQETNCSRDRQRGRCECIKFRNQTVCSNIA
jgi:hypothetical protein